MTGTYHDYEVAAEEKVVDPPLSYDDLHRAYDALHVKHEGLVDRVSETVKEMLDSGNHYWAGRVIRAVSGEENPDL